MRFAGGGLALILASLTFAGAANAAQPPGCAAADIKPGTTDAGLYRTIAPFEHFSSNRTQVFPHTCTLRQLTGSKRPEIAARQSPDDFSTPYIAATRNRGQLFVYGYGANAATEGGYVASVSTHSPDVLDPATANRPATEEVTFVFQTITWTYEPTGATAQDTWGAR